MDSLAVHPIYHPEVDTTSREVCLQSEPHLPYAPIATNPYLWGELVYSIGFLIVITFIRLKGKSFFENTAQLLLKRKKVEGFLSEGIFSNLTYLLLALLLSFSSIAGLFSMVIEEHFISIHTLYFFGALLIFHTLWLALIHLFGWAFNRKQTAQEVAINLWGYHITIGLLTAPFVLTSFYISYFAITTLLNIVIIAFILLTLVKFLRWIEIFYVHKVPIFYMILYLCGLEIVPLLLIYKVVS